MDQGTGIMATSTTVRSIQHRGSGGVHRHRRDDLRGLRRSDRTAAQRSRWRRGQRQLRIGAGQGRVAGRPAGANGWSTRSSPPATPPSSSRTRRRSTDHAAEVDRRARSLGRRLVVAAVLFMPLCDLSIAFSLVPWLRFPYWQWVLIALAVPVLTWAAWPFYKAAIRNARHGTSSMDTLVSLGIVAATGWSVYAMFWRDTSHAPRTVLFVLAHQSGGAIYIDVAAGVTTFLLAGRYFEAWSQASDRERTALTGGGGRQGRRRARRQRDVEHRLPVAQLAVGDRFVVRPGETVATDGEIVFGHSAIDRSAMTGESLPVDVAPGDRCRGWHGVGRGSLGGPGDEGRARHPAGPHGPARRGRPERKGCRPTARRPHRGGLRPRRARHRPRDPRRLAAGRWLLQSRRSVPRSRS